MNRSIVLLVIAADPTEMEAIRTCTGRFSLPYECCFLKDQEEVLAFLERRPPFLEAQRPDLILLSVHPPGNREYDVLRTIKLNADHCSIPTIVTSSGQQLFEQFEGMGHSDLPVVTACTTPDLNVSLQLLAEIDRFWSTPARLLE
jgi:CheY-like chemotaxis protein